MCCVGVGSDETDVGAVNDCEQAGLKVKCTLNDRVLVDVEHADPDSISVMRLRHFTFNLC